MICVSLQGESLTEIQKALEGLEFAEIRIDKTNLAPAEITKLFSSSKIPLVATCRPGTRSDQERFEALSAAIRGGASYVDFEKDSPSDLREKIIAQAREKNCRVILTYHNYEETPMKLVMMHIVDELFEEGANIAKIVCRVKNIQECSRLLSLYEMKKNILALGLGEVGVVTRIIGPLLGAPFTYAALAPGKETAEGQPDLGTLQTMFKLLEKSGWSRSREI